jgi:hypothetical protein
MTCGVVGSALPQLLAAEVAERAKALEVELRALDLERITGSPGHEHGVRLELLSKARDVLLEGGLGISGRVVAPELVDEAVARDRLGRVKHEDRENASLLDPAESDLALAVEHFERSEDAEVERRRQVANVPR